MEPRINRNQSKITQPGSSEEEPKGIIRQNVVKQLLPWQPAYDQQAISKFRIEPLSSSEIPAVESLGDPLHLSKRKLTLLSDAVFEPELPPTEKKQENAEELKKRYPTDFPQTKPRSADKKKPQSREQAWETLRLKADYLSQAGLPAINTRELREELVDWLNFVPLVNHVKKTAEVLIIQISNFCNPIDLMEAIKNFIAPFNGAAELAKYQNDRKPYEYLWAFVQTLKPPFRAVQTLLIYRSCLVRNNNDTLRVASIDKLLSKTLLIAYGPELINEVVKNNKRGMTFSLWEHIQAFPHSEIATLTSWDAWLSSDDEKPNIVIKLLEKQLRKKLDSNIHFPGFSKGAEDINTADPAVSPDISLSSERPDLISHLSHRYLQLLGDVLTRAEQGESEGRRYNKQWLKDQTRKARELDKQKYRDAEFMLNIDTLLAEEYGQAGVQLNKEARRKRWSELSYVKQGLVDGEKLKSIAENHLYRKTLKSFLPRKSQRYAHEVRQFDDKREDPDADVPHNQSRPPRKSMTHYPPPPDYLERGETIRGERRAQYTIKELNQHVYPFHQALEISLADEQLFQQGIKLLDYKAMVVLKASMDLRGVSAELKSAWETRMQDVLLEHYSQVFISKMNEHLHESNMHFLAQKRPDFDGLGSSFQTAFKAVKKSICPEGDRILIALFASKTAPRHELPLSWETLFIKPASWPDDLNEVLADLIPGPKEFFQYLKDAHGLPRQEDEK